MSALAPPMLLLLPVRSLRARGRRRQLERAEQAIDRPFDRRRSLELDQLVLRYEQARRREPAGRGRRWAA